MKAPLHVRKKFDQWMPFLFISIKAHRVRPIPIEVLVDTGSPWIAITPKDILRLNIPIKHLKRATKYPIVTLGAFKFVRFLLRNASVRMREEKGGIVSIDLSSISVLWPMDKKLPKGVKDIPSVLGSDFLTIAKFCLYFNPSKQIAFLES